MRNQHATWQKSQAFLPRPQPSFSRRKIRFTRDSLPEGFTLSLAAVDAIPVLLFCLSMIAIGVRFRSLLFVLGAAAALFAGMTKVLWKIIVVTRRKNIWWMFLQMRILMPMGLAAILASLLVNAHRIDVPALWQAVSSMPSAACFLVSALGMGLMTVFAFVLDAGDARSNWIEQLTNGAAQAALLLGILLLR